MRRWSALLSSQRPCCSSEWSDDDEMMMEAHRRPPIQAGSELGVLEVESLRVEGIGAVEEWSVGNMRCSGVQIRTMVGPRLSPGRLSTCETTAGLHESFPGPCRAEMYFSPSPAKPSKYGKSCAGKTYPDSWLVEGVKSRNPPRVPPLGSAWSDPATSSQRLCSSPLRLRRRAAAAASG